LKTFRDSEAIQEYKSADDALSTGPSPGFSSRGAKNQKEGPKTRRGGNILKMQYWMYVTTGGQM